MSSFSPKSELTARQVEIASILEKIISLDLELFKLIQRFNVETGKLHTQIHKIQFSRPRGNPANIWPHRPMTDRVRLFYQAKESRETFLRRNKDLLKLSFDHSKAIITSRKSVLENDIHDLESQIRLLQVRYPALRLRNN